MENPILIEGEGRPNGIVTWYAKAVPRAWSAVKCRAYIGGQGQIIVSPLSAMGKPKSRTRRIITETSKPSGDGKYEPRLIEAPTATALSGRAFNIALDRGFLAMALGYRIDDRGMTAHRVPLSLLFFEDRIEAWKPESLVGHLAALERDRNG